MDIFIDILLGAATGIIMLVALATIYFAADCVAIMDNFQRAAQAKADAKAPITDQLAKLDGHNVELTLLGSVLTGTLLSNGAGYMLRNEGQHDYWFRTEAVTKVAATLPLHTGTVVYR